MEGKQSPQKEIILIRQVYDCASLLLYGQFGDPLTLLKPQGTILSLPTPKWRCVKCMPIGSDDSSLTAFLKQ